ncbi:MAG: Lrp/AsnC ligand binding domain-containing protein [Candidatus Bathyarchaeia archaeon]
MQRAYVFINAEPGKLWQITAVASKLKGVKMADAITGEFDVILYIELEDMNQLSNLIELIQNIKGVVRTHTSIVIPPRVD